jgi:hypothetical protein
MVPTEAFSDSIIDEMLDRLDPTDRAMLLSLPRFHADRNQNLREVLGDWDKPGIYLDPRVVHEPFEFVRAARDMLTTIREERTRAIGASVTAAVEAELGELRMAAEGGRPTSAELVKTKADERQAIGAQKASKAAEARWLAAWLGDAHQTAPPMSWQTIRRRHLKKYARPAARN